ncbi:DUF1405 domain-containing protein [Paenibacillus spiritus]|uniref:DUF1405 domain-containing protein n=1 Tax=Paenibacillus spiritus TaxID=2496557 RepID=A0A5J5GEG9_9BACL|nr:DUF1405 domain-containing protein [Paenibacillus spiritus]KAA9006258.1 DUF1405 domain-containing protein [Paenibacillus spiritus]
MRRIGVWIQEGLTRRWVIWALLAINIPGTVYGYIWYGNQMDYTASTQPAWVLPFVPDSPTASLFFSLALLFLLYPPRSVGGTVVRNLVEALAVVTSFKYGVWAVTVILAGGYQGGTLDLKDGMLIFSHAGMALEALLYAGKFGCRRMIPAALGWAILNDLVDYTLGVYPWLPSELEDNVVQVQYFTLMLSLFSGALAWLASRDDWSPSGQRPRTRMRRP